MGVLLESDFRDVQARSRQFIGSDLLARAASAPMKASTRKIGVGLRCSCADILAPSDEGMGSGLETTDIGCGALELHQVRCAVYETGSDRHPPPAESILPCPKEIGGFLDALFRADTAEIRDANLIHWCENNGLVKTCQAR